MNESQKRWQREVAHLYIGSIPYDLLSRQDASLTLPLRLCSVAGISRSATTVTAFLMHHLKISCDDAMDMLRNARPAIYPNPGTRFITCMGTVLWRTHHA
jgi:predicted protein tyrosine phosphatase